MGSAQNFVFARGALLLVRILTCVRLIYTTLGFVLAPRLTGKYSLSAV
jgi:hypothetical protein